ncbi:MAG TPA: hypothetical protein DDW91_06865 [Shewanella frigidimarina]|nr:hypothetical protein [Shewanella frigidimarina]
MATYIRTIAKIRFNNVGFDIYENKNGTATIRPENLGSDFPKSKWIDFDSLEELEEFIDGLGMTGVSLIAHLQDRFLSNL